MFTASPFTVTVVPSSATMLIVAVFPSSLYSTFAVISNSALMFVTACFVARFNNTTVSALVIPCVGPKVPSGYPLIKPLSQAMLT